jgi:hypothetical protein
MAEYIVAGIVLVPALGFLVWALCTYRPKPTDKDGE